MIRTLLIAFTLVGITLALSACNTMHGLGTDLEKGGQEIQKATR